MPDTPVIDLPADAELHVLVPSRALGAHLEQLSPRIRAHRLDPADGPPSGDAARARVWVPAGGSGIPDGFLAGLPEGVVLCNARGAHTPSTAEWVVAVALAAQRGLPHFTREQDAGRWTPGTEHSMVGARVLVVGAGDIGRRVGRMLAGFDVDLTYVARRARDGVRATADLPGLLPDADVVVVLVPVTEETVGMVDAGFLAAMKDDALLVNAARGVVVDTDALLAELTAGRLRAALDVTEPEPLPAGHPLWAAPGLLLTPHVAGAVPETGDRAFAAVADQLARVLAGDPLRDVVDAY